jgi:manganese oxidase
VGAILVATLLAAAPTYAQSAHADAAASQPAMLPAPAMPAMSVDQMAWAADTRFQLQDARGATVADTAFHGRFLLLQATAGPCAQACRDRAAAVKSALASLGALAGKLRFVQVSTDPAPGEALHGSAQAVRHLLQGHGVASGDNALLLDDADGVFVERLDGAAPAQSEAQALADRLRRLLTARVSYIGIDEELWDYAPKPVDLMMGSALNAQQQTYVYNKPQQIGSVYLKAVYHGYTDGSFKTRIARPPEWAHLGILGPLLRAEVGDTLRVVVRNNARRAYSLHVHGLRYAASSEGAMTAGVPGPWGIVPPGETYSYVFDVPERAGPGPGDPSSVVWPYHSHADAGVDEDTGLVGAVIVTRKGMARPDGSPKDVDREFVTLFKIFDENRSALLQDNIDRFTEPGRAPAATFLDEDDLPSDADTRAWVDSNQKRAINGYLFANLPGLDMHLGERVRWYVIGLGSESDLHTPHWHGNTVTVGGRREDTVEVLPATTVVADMIPDDAGVWMFHCHVTDHLNDGMTALYRVLPASTPLPESTPLPAPLPAQGPK